MTSNLSSLAPVVIGLIVAGLFIWRQFSTRPVASAWMVLVPLGLGYFGASSVGSLDATGLALLAVNTSFGIGLGVVRGTTFRVWVGERGAVLMRGTRLTLLLWVATIGVRVALSVVEQLAGSSASATGSAALLIPVAATLAAQNVVVYLRSRDQQLAVA
jgi:hypothetical protein